MSLGLGAVFVTVITAANAGVPEQQAELAAGLINTSLQLGTALGLAIFSALAAPHLRAIHLHCYRILGSYHDAQEASQETLLRAWQSLSTFQGRAPLLHWLYRIATTTCLKALAQRARQPVAMAELTDLEPCPDRLSAS